MYHRIFAFVVTLLMLADVSAQVPTLFPFRTKDKYGYVDANNNERLQFIFEVAKPFNEGKAYVENGKWRGYVRENGTWAYYDTVSYNGSLMKMGVAELRRREGSGAIDSTGKIIVPFQYSFLSRYDHLRVFLAYKTANEENGSRKIIHLYTFNGLKVPVDFEEAVAQEDASALGLRQGDNLWVYGKDGKPLLDYPVQDIYSRQYGARVKKNDLYGAINREGKLVMPIRYKNIWISEWAPYAEFSNVSGDTSGYYQLDQGRIAFLSPAILTQPVSDGVAIISYINNLHNVMDVNGRRLGQLQSFEDTSRAKQRSYIEHFQNIHYSEGLVAMRQADKKWYAFDKEGKKVFPKGYEAEFEFTNGVAIVRTNGYSFEYGLINKQGKELLPLIYRSIRRTSEPNVLEVRLNDQYGLIYTSGEFLFPMSPLQFRDEGNGFFMVEGNYADGYFKYGYVNSRTGYIYYDPKDR